LGYPAFLGVRLKVKNDIQIIMHNLNKKLYTNEKYFNDKISVIFEDKSYIKNINFNVKMSRL